MKKKKKIFAVSDIHGHCSALKKALEEAGFIANDESCILIVCGDCFDRGSENKEVFDYLNTIQNKIIIRGNHEDMLEMLLDAKHMSHGGFSNGMDRTLRDFFGPRVIGSIDINYQFSYRLHFEEKQDVVRELQTFINNTYDYFETEHYVFTHGWLPATVDENYNCSVDEDFRYAQPASWYRARFAEWYRMYGAGAMLKGKTIVCGHRASRFCCLLGEQRDPEDYSSFFAEGLAAIDGSTFHSGKVNVLVVEDEVICSETQTMSLHPEPFDKIKSGEKRVELRLFDEKRKKLHVGDRIVFTNTENETETLAVTVIGLHVYRNFDSVLRNFPARDLGFEDGVTSIEGRMLSYYSHEDMTKNGVLAIRIVPENS